MRLYMGKGVMPLPPFITQPEDLITTDAATRSGFIEMALEKGHRANPILAEARALRARAINLGSTLAVIEDEQIREAVLYAAGLSGKALGHLLEEDKIAALQNFKETHLDVAGNDFPDELTYRYLLTRGDALGGTMRNLAGQLADKKFLSGTVASLTIKQRPIQWRHKETKAWAAMTNAEEVSEFGSGLSWSTGGQPRTLIFNAKVGIVRKNVDSVILSCLPQALNLKGVQKPQNNPAFYVCLGELKGGIDPAGADEHWKTARSSIQRINAKFAEQGYNPQKYFVGAAIVANMANEIVNHLLNGGLNYAANLTKDDQMAIFFDWLTDQ
jgi:hypothetical protein